MKDVAYVIYADGEVERIVDTRDEVTAAKCHIEAQGWEYDVKRIPAYERRDYET